MMEIKIGFLLLISIILYVKMFDVRILSYCLLKLLSPKHSDDPCYMQVM